MEEDRAFKAVLFALLLLEEYRQSCYSYSGLVEFLLSLRGRSQAWAKSQLALLESKTGSLKSVNKQAGSTDDLNSSANSNLCLPGIPFTLPF